MEKVFLSKIDNKKYLNFYLNSIEKSLCGLNSEYPDFWSWYTAKVIPGLAQDEREIVLYIVHDYIAGISILKNTPAEKKISTIRVLSAFQKQGIGAQIFKDSLEYLNCDKPVLTIPAVKIPQFQPLLKKFGFKLSSVLNTYGRTRNDEYFYNI
jgi:hypothetical protein